MCLACTRSSLLEPGRLTTADELLKSLPHCIAFHGIRYGIALPPMAGYSHS